MPFFVVLDRPMQQARGVESSSRWSIKQAQMMQGAVQTVLADRRFTGIFTSCHTLSRFANPGVRLSTGNAEIAATKTTEKSTEYELKFPVHVSDLQPAILSFFTEGAPTQKPIAPPVVSEPLDMFDVGPPAVRSEATIHKGHFHIRPPQLVIANPEWTHDVRPNTATIVPSLILLCLIY
jgi:hypothetical protein